MMVRPEDDQRARRSFLHGMHEACQRPVLTVSGLLLTDSKCVLLQADVFSFGVILYELFVGEITSQMIVGPTGNHAAAEIYAAKVMHFPT
jgi:hypothetical protein